MFHQATLNSIWQKFRDGDIPMNNLFRTLDSPARLKEVLDDGVDTIVISLEGWKSWRTVSAGHIDNEAATFCFDCDVSWIEMVEKMEATMERGRNLAVILYASRWKRIDGRLMASAFETISNLCGGLFGTRVLKVSTFLVVLAEDDEMS